MKRSANKNLFIDLRILKALLFGGFFITAGLLASRSYAAVPAIELEHGLHHQKTLVREHGLTAKLRIQPDYKYCFTGQDSTFTTPTAPFIETKAESKNERCVVSRVERIQDVDLELSGIVSIDVARETKDLQK